MWTLPVSAQEEGWAIDRYTSEISIETTGDVRIVDEIDVDFRSLQKHGIYWDVPYVYERDGIKTYSEIKVHDVLQDGNQAVFDESYEDSYLRVRIGDPDRTISGEHFYRIAYTVRGVLRGYDTYDELYWNVIGLNWGVPIEQASATVIFPQDAIEEVSCFSGDIGSTNQCNSQIVTPYRGVFSTDQSLNPYQAFTIAVKYQKGLVPLIQVEKPQTFFEKLTMWPSVVTLFTVVGFGVFTVMFVWFRYGRDFWNRGRWFDTSQTRGEVKPVRSHETIVVEYEPPENLRPGEIGVLIDESAHTHDVTATIIDLAVRGYLTISEIPKKWVFGEMDYLLKKTQKKPDNLLSYEKLLLDSLFDKESEVKLSSLKQTFYSKLKNIKTKLYEDVVSKNFFPTNPERVRSRYIVIAVFLLIVSLAAVFFSIDQGNVFLADLGIGSSVSAVLLLIMSKFMPRRTAHGRELYRRTQGYRLFITTVEKHRQKFFENKNMFNTVLPYAIVFELTDKYIRAMDEMGFKPQTTSWYHGTGVFHMSHFASSMSGFSSSVTRTIASTPSGSGFSSGGGSAGGGFGGSGGGSW